MLKGTEMKIKTMLMLSSWQKKWKQVNRTQKSLVQMITPNNNGTVLKDNIMKAEVIYVIKLCDVGNHSFGDSESKKHKISSSQFPDSIIANSMSIGQTKCFYTLNALADGLK